MKTRLLSLLVSLPIALALLGCDRTPASPDAATLGPSFAATVSVIEDKVLLPAFVAFIPCADGGAGELAVATNAELHVVLRTVVDAAGGLMVSGHFQPLRNWDAIGQVTGDVYQPTGVTRSDFSTRADGLPFESTFVNNFRWIGPGPGNNLLVHATIHLTVNANGDVTADVINATVDCK